MEIPHSCPSVDDMRASAYAWCLEHAPDTLVRDVERVAEATGWRRELVPSREQALAMIAGPLWELTRGLAGRPT